MIQDKNIWAYEKAYLEKVVGEIDRQIGIGSNAADDYKSDAIKLQKSLWEDVRCAPSGLSDLEDAVHVNQVQMELLSKASLYKFSYEKVDHLKRMRGNPYFGRIDFAEKGEEPETFYIGIYNLNSHDTMQSLVFDWRAPVSGMFYDYETGPARYLCPAGIIEGEILLKRQYKIENADIAYMFDSSLIINDGMLQEILGKSTDNRMRTIVTSIQKEQNIVIRNSEDKILVVEGPAGSGKTSIALHRAAYLLYKYRETVKSEDILILSPNHVFEDYISNVLPELGEEDIRRSTFADFFGNAFSRCQRTETMNEQMEYVLCNEPGDIRFDCIRLKSSPLFLAALKAYVEFLECGLDLKFHDLVYNDSLLISTDDINGLYKSQSVRLPYANRLEKIRQRLLCLLNECEEKRKADSPENDENSPARQVLPDYELVKNDILQMTEFDICSMYKNMLGELGSFLPPGSMEQYRRLAEYTVNALEQGTILYEDLASVVYLKTVLEGDNAAASVKHVIIDEAQDYTAVQYEIFKTAFKNCNMTILGDINQTVNGYMNAGSFDVISEILGAGTKRIKLTKSYRSTKELADFSRSILVSKESEQLERHGAKPKVIKAAKSCLYKRIADDIIDLKSRGRKLIAVICKTASQCRAVYHHVGSHIDIGLISNQNETYNDDCFVIPSYLAKGLEFDAVLVCSIEDEDYGIPEDRRLLYTVCTRALHELYLYYSETMSRFVSGIDKNLYTFDEVESGRLEG